MAYGTYKQSVKQDSSIRLQYVKDYLSKRDDIQVKTKPNTTGIVITVPMNSCVSA